MPNDFEQCLHHINRLITVIKMWDQMRGPVQALPPEEVDNVLANVSPITTPDESLPEGLLQSIADTDRKLIGILKDLDTVYERDDCDREVIVARMALCKTLNQLKEHGIKNTQLEMLWTQGECDEWCV